MNTMTISMHAASCVASARLRPADVLLAALRIQDQGTTVSFAGSFAGSADLRPVTAAVPFWGFGARVAVITDPATYKTSDVARSHFGRPPV